MESLEDFDIGLYDVRVILQDMFPNKSSETIDNIVKTVEENCEETRDIQIESMINLLSYTGWSDVDDAQAGPSGYNKDVVANRELASDNEMEFYEDDSEDDSLLDEAAGYDQSTLSQTLQRLMDIFPNADPSYLSSKASELLEEEHLNIFIANTLEANDYPTREEYEKRENKKKELMEYTSNFHLYEFLKEFPYPKEYFCNLGRVHSLTQDENKKPNETQQDEEYVINFLYNQFCYLRKRDIAKLFNSCNKNLVVAAMKLRKLPQAFKKPRDREEMKEPPENILLHKEIAFIAHINEIEHALKVKEENLNAAKKLGVLETCTICYVDDLVPEECFICRNGCIFCRDCLKKGIEVIIADEKLETGCLNECGGDFSLTTLQMVLDKKTFSHFWRKKQLYEIEKAHVDGLEFCCLCYQFATIPNPEDKIFHCLACGKDSCRECKHESHVPLKCREVEYDEDVKRRTYIENKMTEALVRTCYKCKKQFLKTTGCNKIQCPCGAKMCYLCSAPISDYTHFKEFGGCKLFTDDNLIHFENVKAGAAKAKVDLGVDKNPELLKFDPTRGMNMD